MAIDPRRSQRFRTWWLLAILGANVIGCAEMTYQKIQLGQTPDKYEMLLPAESSRKTSLGLCHMKRDLMGRTDALVVLLSEDRRVAAKLLATHYERNYGFKVDRGDRLVGELDPTIYGAKDAGPIDALRSVARAISSYQGEKIALETHAWVAAGLVRLLQAWPRVEDVGAEARRLSELFELVPGGGTTRIEIDGRGIYRFSYEQGVLR